MASAERFFSRHAGSYEAVAGVQRSVATCLAGWLPELSGRVLEIGCGTGYLTRHLPAEGLMAIDAAPGMVAKCRERCPDVEVACADFLRDELPSGAFDWVVSSAALHWITPMEETTARMARVLRPGGRVGVSLMVDGTLAELHAARRAEVPGVPPLQRLPDLAGLIRAFREAGFVEVELRVREWTCHHASGMEFLRDLHRGGLTGGAVSRGERLLTRGELGRIARRLEAGDGRESDGGDKGERKGVASTYRVATVFAQADPNRAD